MEVLESKKNYIVIDEQDPTKQKNFVLYSYNVEVARYTKNFNCRGLLLLTKYYNFSKTTTKHLNNFIFNYCEDITNTQNKRPNTSENIDKKYIFII